MHNAIQSLEPRRLLTSIVPMYTYAGDGNLDGTISGDDYGVIDSALEGGSSGFAYGDWNYDGVIDAADAGGEPANLTDFSGTAKRDVIVVSRAPIAGGVNVSVNGNVTLTFPSKLRISANGGNDKIHIDLDDAFANLPITIYGGAGDDVIVGGSCAERIIAGDGNDYIVGNGGRDTVYAEAGDDSVRGGGSSDLLDGGAGDDTIRGDGGNDRMSGGDGFDRMRGSTGDDTLNGGASKDVIAGELGKDSLCGDGGGDVLSGGEDNDILNGGAGSDYCSGDGGDDTLAGGSGVDELCGAGGQDICATSDDLGERKDSNTSENSGSTGGGKIDIKDNNLTAGGGSGGVYSGIQGAVQSGSSTGSWDGPGLITSMPIPGALGGLTTVGVATGEQTGGSFAGQTITGASTIAMYTYAGDANLDGLVDGEDYGVIDNFVQVPGVNGYTNGDFNYDGVIDAGDYGIIDAAAQQPPIKPE
jgi:Ca2+-binding RTX toxin-like protein